MEKKTPCRRIAAHYALTPSGLLPWGVVTLADDGTVLSVESHEGVDSHYGVEFYSGILIPGMVNAHTHLELSYLKGQITPGGGFIGFADGLGAVRGKFMREQMEQAADYQDARMYAEGVAAVGDISNGDVTFGVKRRSRMHYHTFLELYGLGAHAASLDPLADKARACGLAATVTPHSTYSLNDRAFREAAGEAGNSPLSIHFMESREEEELYRGEGAMRDWYAERGWRTDFTGLYDSPADRIIRCIPADRRVMLVHNTFITEREVGRLAAHFGDNVTFVLCPCSNRYINDSTPPAQMLLHAGVRVAVGTDSLASNTALSMVGELKMLTGVPLEERLRWATLSGAQALGADVELGSLEAGKRPGVVLLGGVDWDTMELRPDASARRLA